MGPKIAQTTTKKEQKGTKKICFFKITKKLSFLVLKRKVQESITFTFQMMNITTTITVKIKQILYLKGWLAIATLKPTFTFLCRDFAKKKY